MRSRKAADAAAAPVRIAQFISGKLKLSNIIIGSFLLASSVRCKNNQNDFPNLSWVSYVNSTLQ